MAPKSPSKSLSTADNTDNNIDKDKPSWDTSPITKPGYLVTLCRWLPAQDENHRLLVERGVTMYKHQTVVVSVNHMDRHRHGLLPKGTFQKPTIVLPGDNSLVGLPEADALTTARATYEKRYFINPDAIDKANGRLLTDILGTIDDMDTREELRIECQDNGSTLLASFESDRAASATDDTGNFGEKVSKDIEDHLARGLADASVSSFNAFKSELTLLVGILPNDLQAGWGESVLARKLAAAVKAIGPLLKTRLENQMMHTNAAGKAPIR